MQDPPTAPQLLGAIADTLEHRVLPNTSGAAQHDVRVAANLCRILQRESELEGTADAQTRRALAELVGHDGPTTDLWHELAEQIAADAEVGDGVEDQADGGLAARSFDSVLAAVRAKVAVAKPGYDRHEDEPADADQQKVDGWPQP